MSVKDHKVQGGQGIATIILPLTRGSQIPASQTDYEVISVRLPSNTDWLVVDAYAFARAVAGSPKVNLQDDGTDLGTDTTIAAGSQTAITGVSNEKVKGGSELQVVVTTAGGETVDDLCVTVRLEPLYLYNRLATAAPS